MEDYKRLLLNNKAWVKDKQNLREDFFSRHAGERHPNFLWIGSSDSRVSAEDITGTEPGELFVHRNIGNMVIHTDFNMLSVLQYAIQVHKVKHIIVCGHYGCGGVAAAMSKKDLGLMNKWVRHIKDVYRFHHEELDRIADDDARIRRLTELNVIEQAHRLTDTSFVQKAWKEGSPLTIHGWIYDIETGLIKDLLKIDPGQHPHNIYEYEFND